MKKLMMVAAIAAMSGVALADAQVYDMKLTVKTTKCVEGKAQKGWITNERLGGAFDKGDELVYRKQASTVFSGVLFGCDCNESLAGFWGQCDNHWYGLTFWNKAGEFLGGAHDATTLNWWLLQRIGNTGDELELAFDLEDATNGDDTFYFFCAGFGKAKNAFAKPTDCNGADEDVNDCDSYIASAKGYFAGWMSTENICTYCTETGCDAWQFCLCLDIEVGNTVAYGTWTLKYNKTASSKLRTRSLISQAYTKFPATVKEALVKLGE